MFLLALIGGILAAVVGLVTMLLGTFFLSGAIIAIGIFVALLGVVGIVCAVVSKTRPRGASITLIVFAIIGLVMTQLYFAIPGILYVIAGVIGLKNNHKGEIPVEQN